jgi:hypothetical protein
VAATAIAGVVAMGEGRKHAATPSGPAPSGSLKVVTDDPSFPQFERGFRRLAVVELPVGAEGSVDLTPLQLAGRRIYAWRYCTGPQDLSPTLRLVSGAQVKYLDCPTRAAAATAWPIVLWYPEDAGRRVAVNARSGNAGEGTARIAFYQEASWEQYRLPPRPADLDTNPAYAWSTRQGVLTFVGPEDPNAPNVRRTITVPYRDRMGVGIQARGPGSLTLRLNGRSLDLFCGNPGRIAVCLPEQPMGDTLTTWAYGHAEGGLWFDDMPGLEVGKPLTITVEPSHFQGDDWRLLVGIREK